MSSNDRDEQARTAIESLEARVFLSATLSSKGTLVAEGTNGNDAIVIKRDPQRASKILVSIGSLGTKFDAPSVKRIEMYGLGGADRLTLDDSLGIISARGASLFGGNGNDTLVGGLASATFDGGNDDDSILGSSKADLILGQSGKDTLVGGKGDDEILAGPGNDLLYGSAGDDQLYGDAGNDTAFGEDGNDTLAGDGEDQFWFKGLSDPTDPTGNDSLDGGKGADWITGGDQSTDLTDQNNGLDTIIGGAGNDVLDARGGGSNPADEITDRQSGDVVPTDDHTRTWTSAEIALGEDAFKVHVHARLNIFINDNGTMRQVQIPAGLGDFSDPAIPNTAFRMHVHFGSDEDGVIHMHDVDSHVFTLAEFFRNWGVTLDADHIGRYIASNGHTLRITVKHGGINGTKHTIVITDPLNYVIQGATDPDNGDLITITYT